MILDTILHRKRNLQKNKRQATSPSVCLSLGAEMNTCHFSKKRLNVFFSFIPLLFFLGGGESTLFAISFVCFVFYFHLWCGSQSYDSRSGLQMKGRKRKCRDKGRKKKAWAMISCWRGDVRTPVCLSWGYSLIL